VTTPPYDPDAEAPRDEPTGEAEQRCPRCGAPHDPLQEYCLECGERLVRLPGSGYRTSIWSRESPIWLWVALAALLLLALAAGAIAALAATDEDGTAAASAPLTTGRPATAFETGTSPISIDTLTTPSTLTSGPTTTSSTATASTTSTWTTSTMTTTGTGSRTIISWPSGKHGFTVVLRSTPTSDGRSVAEYAAHRAISAGLRDVGVLSSSNYSSLNPGYYVTFTGVYDTLNGAENALPGARNAGFATAYLREIVD
jgi:hypothetical protein